MSRWNEEKGEEEERRERTRKSEGTYTVGRRILVGEMTEENT